VSFTPKIDEEGIVTEIGKEEQNLTNQSIVSVNRASTVKVLDEETEDNVSQDREEVNEEILLFNQ